MTVGKFEQVAAFRFIDDYTIEEAVVPLQTHGRYNEAVELPLRERAVVPLQTHGRYNKRTIADSELLAVVPLQTHGRYNQMMRRRERCVSRGSPTDTRAL